MELDMLKNFVDIFMENGIVTAILLYFIYKDNKNMNKLAVLDERMNFIYNELCELQDKINNIKKINGR